LCAVTTDAMRPSAAALCRSGWQTSMNLSPIPLSQHVKRVGALSGLLPPARNSANANWDLSTYASPPGGARPPPPGARELRRTRCNRGIIIWRHSRWLGKGECRAFRACAQRGPCSVDISHFCAATTCSSNILYDMFCLARKALCNTLRLRYQSCALTASRRAPRGQHARVTTGGETLPRGACRLLFCAHHSRAHLCRMYLERGGPLWPYDIWRKHVPGVLQSGNHRCTALIAAKLSSDTPALPLAQHHAYSSSLLRGTAAFFLGPEANGRRHSWGMTCRRAWSGSRLGR